MSRIYSSTRPFALDAGPFIAIDRRVEEKAERLKARYLSGRPVARGAGDRVIHR